MGQCVVFGRRSSLTQQCLPVSYPRNLCVLLRCLPPFLCMRTAYWLYLIPLGGPHSVKGKGSGYSELGNVEISLWKGDCLYHLSENSKVHFYVSKARSMWPPSVLWIHSLVPAPCPITLSGEGQRWHLTHSLDFVQKRVFLSIALMTWLGERWSVHCWSLASRAGKRENVLSTFPYFTLIF